MTREEWWACTDPKVMLRFLIGTDAPRVDSVVAFPDCRGSDRKLRLFACACFDRLRPALQNKLARLAVEVAEEFADGKVTVDAFHRMATAVYQAAEQLEWSWRASQGAQREARRPDHDALALAHQIVRPEAQKAAWYASSNAYLSIGYLLNPGAGPQSPGVRVAEKAEKQSQCDDLRCIFGTLPFAPAVREQPSWWTVTVAILARKIYAGRDFGSLPELASAVEQAGCRDPDMLVHLRSPGPHVRGCWALDTVLGLG
jgi:hypothetical protein